MWVKNRSSNRNHYIYDAIRGAGTSGDLAPNTTDAEDTLNTGLYGYLSAFTSDGFTVVNGTDSSGNFNSSSQSYMAWAWDAGTSNTPISAGSQNSSAYFMSQTWSNGLTGLSGSNITNPSNAFNGSESGYADSTAGFTLDLSGYTFGAGTHTIELKSGGASSFTVNGSTSLSTTGSSGAIVWTGTHVGELTSLVSSATGASLYYLKIDGKFVVDSGTSVTNVPSIASTCRANQTSGMSIVSWTGNGTSGSTIGHALNAAPKMVIFKNRDSATNWRVYNTMADGSLDWLYLNTTAAKSDSGLSLPTSTTFTAGSSADTNNNGDEMIAYCFAPVEGFSAFGSYTGNGSTDGPFVFTGFRPRWIMFKNTTSAIGWYMLDTQRDEHNVSNTFLFANTSGAEGNASTSLVDILSSGFKLRGTGDTVNASSANYIYAAFAEHPFKTARAR